MRAGTGRGHCCEGGGTVVRAGALSRGRGHCCGGIFRGCCCEGGGIIVRAGALL